MTTHEAAPTEGQNLLVKIPEKVPQKEFSAESSYGTTSLQSITKEISNDDLMFQDGRRLYCLDVVRIVCVCLVAVNHGESSWSDQFGLWNEMYVQQWVLQWLFIVCGMSFGMSSRGMCGYLSRLLLYFVIGVCTNWCAFIIAGREWKNNFWNVVFQFWFIFGLMLFVIILTPLKQYLRALRSRSSSAVRFSTMGLVNGLTMIGMQIFLINLMFRFALAPVMNYALGDTIVLFSKGFGSATKFWGMPMNAHESLLFIQELLSYVQVSVGSIMILWVFPKWSRRLALTNWIVLFNVFFFRCFWLRGQFARIVDGFDFTMIGLVNFYLGLSYRRTIGQYMVRYWFAMLFIFALLIPPGTWGRFDEKTILDLSFRIRYHLVELAMTLLLLCAGERLADAAIFTEDNLDWLSWWALYLFLFHKAVHIVVPHPFNWLVLVLLAPLTWLIHGKRAAAKAPPPVEQSTACKDVEKATESEVS